MSEIVASGGELSYLESFRTEVSHFLFFLCSFYVVLCVVVVYCFM